MISCSLLGGYQHIGGWCCPLIQDPEQYVEVAYFSETLVFSSKGLRCYSSEDHELNTHRHDKLKTYVFAYLSHFYVYLLIT
jgi:hypothetical protein